MHSYRYNHALGMGIWCISMFCTFVLDSNPTIKVMSYNVTEYVIGCLFNGLQNGDKNGVFSQTVFVWSNTEAYGWMATCTDKPTIAIKRNAISGISPNNPKSTNRASRLVFIVVYKVHRSPGINVRQPHVAFQTLPVGRVKDWTPTIVIIE